MKRLKFYVVTFCRSAWQLFVFLCKVVGGGIVGFFVALFHLIWNWKKYFKASPDNPPKKLILGWLAVIGVFSGVLFYAIQANNRIMVMILAAVYVAFGFYVTGRINRKNKEMVYVENTGWRELRGARGIPSWKRAIKFILFVAFILFLGYLFIFVKTDP